MHRICIYLLLFPALSMLCPRFSCRTLPPSTCALKHSSADIYLSTDVCRLDYFCPAELIFTDWWWYGFLAVGSTFSCLPLSQHEHMDLSDGEVYTEWPCEEWEAGKNLAVGSHPKDCRSEDDCMLQDGSFSSCSCGIRSSTISGICSPHMSSEVFDPYWRACKNGLIEEKNLGFYYSVLQKVYVFAQTDLDCATRVIWEINLLSSVHYQLNSHSRLFPLSCLLIILA